MGLEKVWWGKSIIGPRDWLDWAENQLSLDENKLAWRMDLFNRGWNYSRYMLICWDEKLNSQGRELIYWSGINLRTWVGAQSINFRIIYYVSEDGKYWSWRSKGRLKKIQREDLARDFPWIRTLLISTQVFIFEKIQFPRS